MTLAERYKQARIAAGLSQAELSRLACITPTTISKIEQGKILKPRNLDLHAKALGVSEIYLSFGNDYGTSKKNIRSKEYQALCRSLKQLDEDGFLEGEIFQIINNAISIANIHHRRITTNK